MDQTIARQRDRTGDSRRSFMAKGALAAGTLVLGTAAFGTATVGGQGEQTAIFSNNYYPGARFDVIASLQTNTTVAILREEGDTIPEISQPDEWTGYIIRYDIGDIQEAGITTFLFTREQQLSAGESGTIGEDASMLSSQLNLLSTSITEGTEEGPQPLEEDEISDFEEALENESEETENSGG